MAETYLLATRCPVYRRHDSHLGSCMELENLSGDAKGKGTSSETVRPKVPMRRVGADCSVIARKRGNARGAKGGRKVETLNKRTKETAPSMSYGLSTVKSNRSTRTFNSCPVPVGRLGNESLPLIEPERSMEASADLLWS